MILTHRNARKKVDTGVPLSFPECPVGDAAKRFTLPFIHCRPNRRNPNRDVLGSVSLIREIDAANSQRAHLDILAELSLQ